MCFVCGKENHMSLNAQFLNLEDKRICALFQTTEEHQSYPGRVHGGVISAILDETIGRVIQCDDPDAFGVTIELNVKFRKPVPLGVPLRVIAWETKRTSRIFEGEGELLLEDGSVAAQATARYFNQEIQAIAEGDMLDTDWYEDDRIHPNNVTV
jgi:uncharacterized protein (TIGR00369 family)